MNNKKKKIICAMSGGVDSSVAAALLKKQGHDVVGVFMKFWSAPVEAMRIYADSYADLRGNENKCCSARARIDAKKVAIKLNIPFYILNVQKEFKKRVVDYLIREYKNGRTPNPCVECNRWIKFKFLTEKAMALKADYIATGHYAKIKFVNSKQIRYSLIVAKDKQKDQSYFLWTLNQKQLKQLLFPVGDYTKEQVRGMAKKFGLPVFKKRDSQEICFVNDLKVFLKKYIKTKKGDILTVDGKKVGEHKGLVFYTIGQRKGIEIGGIGPFYVVKKDFKNNALIVSNSEKDLLQKEMMVENINWISGKSFSGRCKVKIRSTALMVPAKIMGNKIIFDKKQRAVTPGQSAVFYRENEVVGGGIIKK